MINTTVYDVGSLKTRVWLWAEQKKVRGNVLRNYENVEFRLVKNDSNDS